MAATSPQPYRLATAGLVDRSSILPFRFDNRAYEGHPGDTLASALLANGIRLIGRSFKYHRPRGILTAGSEEPNALVELRCGSRREPNTRATVAELFGGLDARSQNRWPSLAFDVGAINSLLAPLFVAGFYYKTFMWPPRLWESLYEPAIRRVAGLGRASQQDDPDSYEKAHAFCDILIVGAGPAGLSAALAAARSGARVILCDEDFIFGGRLNAERHVIDDMGGADWARQAVAELEAMPDVRLMRRTTVFGAYDGGTYGAIERVADHLPLPLPGQPRQRLWKIVARQAVLTSGALERPLVFGGNDRPGVMMASAVRAYLNRYAVAPGSAMVLFTTTDDGWRTAADWAAAGLASPTIVDARAEVAPLLLAQARQSGARVITGAEVIATAGYGKLRRVTVRGADGQLTQLPADLLAMSGGWNPTLALSTHLGGRPRWSDSISSFVPGNPPPAMRIAGAANGAPALADALREGSEAGAAAVRELGFEAPTPPPFRTDDEPSGQSALWHVGSSVGKAFVDFQHDVTVDDISLAAREGYRSVELLKRYTTLGMATDQGKNSNVNGHAIVAALTGQSMEAVGTTVSRPPYTPVAINAFAGLHRGRQFRPARLTPTHGWAARRGAAFVEVGQWLRAKWYTAPGDSDWRDTVSREVRAVRSAAGICDVSTLGKIDVQGSDAAAFLDRIYTNRMSTLPVGKVRYGVMLREDGIVLDDGTAARFGEQHFIISTTTANAGLVMQHMEHARQVLWPELDIQLQSVTEQWAQYAVAGPRSRDLLCRLLGDALPIDNDRFPHLACAEFYWRGVRARLFRISFSGELAYELAVPARFGAATHAALLGAGEPFEAVPYGTEALAVLRIEKGHVAGPELNGRTTAHDLGLGGFMSAQKDFVGAILARRPGLADAGRPTLVGVRPVDPADRLTAGAHFLDVGAAATLANDQGHLTSVAFSPTLGHWIGLGFLSDGPRRVGERVVAHNPLSGSDVVVEVCAPTFIDAEGGRLRG